MIKCPHRTSTSFLRHLLFRHPPELIKLPVSDPDECHDLWSIGYWWDKCTGSRKSPDSAPGLMTNQSIFPNSSVLHCMKSSVLCFPTDTDCNKHLLPFVFTKQTWHLNDWQYPKGIRHCSCKQLNISNTTDKHHTHSITHLSRQIKTVNEIRFVLFNRYWCDTVQLRVLCCWTCLPFLSLQLHY